MVELESTLADAALYLSIDELTLDRWIDGTEHISHEAYRALESWRCLQKHRLPWRPTLLPLNCVPADISAHLRFHREATQALALATINNAARRSEHRWTVNLETRAATLTPLSS